MQFAASSEKLTREIAELELALAELETPRVVPEIFAKKASEAIETSGTIIASVRRLTTLSPATLVQAYPRYGVMLGAVLSRIAAQTAVLPVPNRARPCKDQVA